MNLLYESRALRQWVRDGRVSCLLEARLGQKFGDRPFCRCGVDVALFMCKLCSRPLDTLNPLEQKSMKNVKRCTVYKCDRCISLHAVEHGYLCEFGTSHLPMLTPRWAREEVERHIELRHWMTDRVRQGEDPLKASVAVYRAYYSNSPPLIPDSVSIYDKFIDSGRVCTFNNTFEQKLDALTNPPR